MRRRRWPLVLVATAAMANAVLFGLEGLAESHGHSLDPTDSMNYDFFALRNDSATPRYVHLCDDASCTRLDGHFDWVAVRPGSLDTEQVYWDSSSTAVYAVATSPALGSGSRCLVLNASTKLTSTADAPLSTAGPCAG